MALLPPVTSGPSMGTRALGRLSTRTIEPHGCRHTRYNRVCPALAGIKAHADIRVQVTSTRLALSLQSIVSLELSITSLQFLPFAPWLAVARTHLVTARPSIAIERDLTHVHRRSPEIRARHRAAVAATGVAEVRLEDVALLHTRH